MSVNPTDPETVPETTPTPVLIPSSSQGEDSTQENPGTISGVQGRIQQFLPRRGPSRKTKSEALRKLKKQVADISFSLSEISDSEDMTSINPQNPNLSNILEVHDNSDDQSDDSVELPEFKKVSEITRLIRHEFSGSNDELQPFLDDAILANAYCPKEFKRNLFVEIVSHITKGARADLQAHPELQKMGTIKGIFIEKISISVYVQSTLRPIIFCFTTKQ